MNPICNSDTNICSSRESLNNQDVPPVGANWRAQGGIYLGVLFAHDGRPLWHLVSSETDIRDVTWGTSDSQVTIAEVLDGQANMRALVDKQANTSMGPHVQSLTWQGFSDWYIGAQEEVMLQFEVLGRKMMHQGCYWTSTSYSSASALCMGYRTTQISAKGLLKRVRPMRRVAI